MKQKTAIGTVSTKNKKISLNYAHRIDATCKIIELKLL